MKVGILHHDLEWAETKIAEILAAKGVDVNMYDVRDASVEDIFENDLILNRVYASVSNRDYPSILKTLNLLKSAEKKGVPCLNSCETSRFDYDKYASFLLMSKAGIPTPKTILIKTDEKLRDVVKILEKELKFPMIIKRNIGGRGKDVSRVENYDEALADLVGKFNGSNKEGYFGGFVAQELVRSSRDYDCRLGVIGGNVEFSYNRTLLSVSSEDKWLASTTNGSIEGIYEAEEIESEMGVRASRLIGADFNELDIMFTLDGPVVIENNPTPNYFNTADDRKRIEQFVEVLLDKFDFGKR